MLLCSIITLSACSQNGRPEWVKSMLGESDRDDRNIVVGAKHAPAFNPKTGDANASRAGHAITPPPSMKTNPYDYFDDYGNPITPSPSAMQPPPPAKPVPMPRRSFPGSAPEPQSSLQPLTVPPPVPVTETPVAPPGAAEKDAEKDLSYPSLSSVPKIPPQMQAIKAGRQQQMEDMRQTHLQAEEQRQAIGAEPMQTPAATAP